YRSIPPMTTLKHCSSLNKTQTWQVVESLGNSLNFPPNQYRPYRFTKSSGFITV
ncbi:hypothetical protein STEG23_006732, partial [Scotinomys teguina]